MATTWCGVITVHFDVGVVVPDAVVLVVYFVAFTIAEVADYGVSRGTVASVSTRTINALINPNTTSRHRVSTLVYIYIENSLF